MITLITDIIVGLIVAGIIFSLVYFDARFLKSKNKTLYRTIMQIPPHRWGIYCALLIFVPAPLYIWFRYCFYKKLNSARSQNLQRLHKSRIISDALGILIIWSCSLFFLELFLKLVVHFGNFEDQKLMYTIISVLIESALMIYLIYRMTRAYPRGGFRGMIGWESPKPSVRRSVLKGITLGSVLAFLSTAIVMIRPNDPITPLSQMIDANHSSLAFAFFILVAIVIAPFIEEIIFRGYFFRVLDSTIGRRRTILIISGIFAALHVHQYWGDWLAIMAVAFVGFSLTILRAETRSIIPGIWMHYTYNACVTVLPIIFLTMSSPAYVEYTTRYNQLDFVQKESLLLQSIEDRPNFSTTYNDLAWLYAEQGVSLDRALSLVEQALTLNVDHPAYLDTKAEILFKLNRQEEAAAITEKLVNKYSSVEYYKEQLRKFQKH